MENTTIEITEEKKKVGAGIITMSVLYLLANGIMILFSLLIVIFKDAIIEYAKTMGLSEDISTAGILIPLAISVIIVIAVILILAKKPIGAYLFIATEVLSRIYGIIVGGFEMSSILGLIFPALMIFFIYKKKDIYFTKA